MCDLRDNVDGTKNDLRHVGVAYADRSEDCCAIVEEVAPTRQLLESKDRHAQGHAVKHARTGEYFVPWVSPPACLTQNISSISFNMFSNNGVVRIHTGKLTNAIRALSILPRR